MPSELNAAYLYAQLEKADVINNARLDIWEQYRKGLQVLEEGGKISLPQVPSECTHNAHMFYIKAKDLEERTRLIEHLKAKNILAVFHYVPLHTSPAGKKFGRFFGEDQYTTKESERLLRLPMYYGLEEEQINYVIEQIKGFYYKK